MRKSYQNMSAPDIQPTFEALLDYLRLLHGFDFTGYKRSFLIRRVQTRMQQIDITSYSDYVSYLQAHPEEFIPLFNTILINFTGFFRDASDWEYVASEIIPRIIAGKSESEPIRVWSAGCASGEEAYTIAILLLEALGVEQFQKRVRIFASDVDTDALAQARKGRYRHDPVMGLPPHLLEQYFEQDDYYYVFRQDLRPCFVFSCRNLIQNAPMNKIDLLLCRNVLIYLNMEEQIKVLARFHFGLLDSGFLFLGKPESADINTKLFTLVNPKHRVFAKVLGAHRDHLLLPKAFLSGRRNFP